MKKILAIITLCLVLLSVPFDVKGATSFVSSDYSRSYALMIGEKVELKTGNVEVIKWVSKDKKIATVSKNGVVNAKKTGKTVVTAKLKDGIIEYTVSVSKATKAQSVLTGYGKDTAVDNKIEYVTKSKYNSVSNGQTYDSVVKIMGTGGSLMSFEEDSVSKNVTEVYNWTSEDGVGTAAIIFVNGKVTKKADMFLK